MSESNKKVILVDISTIATFNWDKACAQRLRARRKKTKLSRKALSAMTKISEGYIQQLESPWLVADKKNGFTVSVAILQNLCAALDTEISRLIGCSECDT